MSSKLARCHLGIDLLEDLHRHGTTAAMRPRCVFPLRANRSRGLAGVYLSPPALSSTWRHAPRAAIVIGLDRHSGSTQTLLKTQKKDQHPHHHIPVLQISLLLCHRRSSTCQPTTHPDTRRTQPKSSQATPCRTFCQPTALGIFRIAADARLQVTWADCGHAGPLLRVCFRPQSHLGAQRRAAQLGTVLKTKSAPQPTRYSVQALPGQNTTRLVSSTHSLVPSFTSDCPTPDQLDCASSDSTRIRPPKLSGNAGSIRRSKTLSWTSTPQLCRAHHTQSHCVFRYTMDKPRR